MGTNKFICANTSNFLEFVNYEYDHFKKNIYVVYRQAGLNEEYTIFKLKFLNTVFTHKKNKMAGANDELNIGKLKKKLVAIVPDNMKVAFANVLDKFFKGEGKRCVNMTMGFIFYKVFP